jgi:hypothetical protein
MGVFARPEEIRNVDVPQKKALHAGDVDVLVVGGSLAGMAAAWAAAQTGAKVVLAEKEGFLGGDATASLVTIFMSYHTQHPKPPERGEVGLFPSDFGDGKQAIGGFYTMFVDRLVQAGGALPPSARTGYTLAIDPEIFKITAFEVLEEAGVDFLLYAAAENVVGENNVKGVVFGTKSGPVLIGAKAVIDATGDGDVAELAGAPFQLGREQDGYTQPITLYFIIDGFDRRGFGSYVQQHPDQWSDVYGLWDLVRKARENSDLDLQRENILMFGTPHEDKVVVDSTRVIKVSGVDAWDRTHAALENFKQMRDIALFFKHYVPGFEHSRIAQSGPALYVRESRRIIGDHILTADDVLSGRKFDDVIASGAYCIDIHNPVGSGTTVRHLQQDTMYDIPLRCLIPKNTENLLVTDRAISGTHVALASYRVLPIGAATGQAAGVCAALAAQRNTSPRNIDVRSVQDILLKQKAILGGKVLATA